MNDPYSDRVRALFADTAHAGDLEGGASGFVDDQGIRIRLTAATDGGILTMLRFRAYGCPHVVAACEAICRQCEGQPVEHLESVDSDRIMVELAVPAEKTGRILVVEDTVRSLAAAIRDRQASGRA